MFSIRRYGAFWSSSKTAGRIEVRISNKGISNRRSESLLLRFGVQLFDILRFKTFFFENAMSAMNYE